MGIWVKTMEDRTWSSIEESSGIREATCIESIVRNWRDPPQHQNFFSSKNEAYKPSEVVDCWKGQYFIQVFRGGKSE